MENIAQDNTQENTQETTADTTFFGVTIPKFDLPKVELPKVEFPKVDLTALNDLAEVVRNAASDTMLTATQTATKVRNGAAHTVTLVREAVGV